ncbi:DUF4352 domain-containing protein [Rhodococcus ruber]
MSNSPPPGWYPDSRDATLMRYWDGREWTATSRPEHGETSSGALPTTSSSRVRREPWSPRQSLLVAAGITAVLAVVTIVGANTDGDSGPLSPAVTATPSAVTVSTAPVPPTAQEAANGIGIPHRDGDLEFVVSSWDGAIASLTVTNIGTSPQSFSYADQDLFDTEGRRFAASVKVTSDLVLAALNPGESVSGELKFELSGATAERLELHESMFSDGVSVPLR